MPRLLLLALVLAVTLAASCTPEAETITPAGVDVSGDPDELVARARALLDAGRPWRAAQVMDAYRDDVDGDMPAEHRLLGARAHAGWGRWEAVPTYLDGTPGLDTLADGLGLYLLARAHDDADEPDRAADAYRLFLDTPATDALATERAATRLRLGLALARAGQTAAADSVLAEVRAGMGGAARWVDLLEAEAYAARGDASAAERLAREHGSGMLGLRARRARIDAARVAGDLERAAALARDGFGWARTDATRAAFKVSEARLLTAQGKTDAARAALRRAIALDASGEAGQEAAVLLRAAGLATPADHLASARVYAGLGLHEQAAADFQAWLDAGTGSAAEAREIRIALANTLIAGQMYDRALDVLEPLGDDATARDLRASALSRAGETERAAEIYLGLAAEARGTDAASALYFAADAYQQGGDADAARPFYERVVAEHDGSRWMGLALMRLAGLAFLEGEHARAASLWDDYRRRYPNGDLALQSTYWAARAHAEAGDAATATRLYRTVRQQDRSSYYALRASERLGEPFWPLPMREAPPKDTNAERRVANWMAPVDRLREAGFHQAASDEVDRIVDAAPADRGVRYALAEALVERGYTQRAIRIGLGLQRSGYNPRLLRILYPFPYRELIRDVAQERGFDPTVAAALIRQESMFEARITSHVGARGLMQIMPATGAELAEAHGIDEWDADFLYEPEIAAHLGTAYLAQALDDYDGTLPAVFAAYNAGPHQVDQWKTFPEFDADEELFTERIPFRETRDYVKKLTRNRAIYQGLYGENGGVE